MNKCLGYDQSVDTYISAKDKRVVVLGGGIRRWIAIVLRSVSKPGNVTCAYRRDEHNMPGSRKEVANAKEEGVKFLFNRQPVEIVGTGVLRVLR